MYSFDGQSYDESGGYGLKVYCVGMDAFRGGGACQISTALAGAAELDGVGRREGGCEGS